MFGEFLTSIPAPYPKKGQGSVMNQSQILCMSIKFVLSSPKFRNFDSERKTLVRVRTEGRSTGSKKVHYMHSSSTCNSTSKVYVSCMYSEHKKKQRHTLLCSITQVLPPKQRGQFYYHHHQPPLLFAHSRAPVANSWPKQWQSCLD